MPTRRRKDRSSFPPRRSIIRFFRWFAIRMRGRFRRRDLPLPQNRFRHPGGRARTIDARPGPARAGFRRASQGVWPSEGSVSEEALAIAHSLGIKWMATDEGVLGRSTGLFFARDGNGRLPAHAGGEALQHLSL